VQHSQCLAQLHLQQTMATEMTIKVVLVELLQAEWNQTAMNASFVKPFVVLVVLVVAEVVLRQNLTVVGALLVLG